MTQSDCAEIPLHAYLDEDPDLDRAALESHLTECDRCRRHLVFLRQFREKFAQSESEIDLPIGFQERLLARLDRPQSTPLSVKRPLSRWAMAFGLAACLMLACWQLLPSNSPPEAGLVSDMVNHHQVCWDIPASPGRRQHFQRWVQTHPGEAIPSPFLASASLRESERRDCPVGEGAHGPHLMFKRPDGKRVSLYCLPSRDLKGWPVLSEKPQFHNYQGYAVVVWQRGEWLFGVVAQDEGSEVMRWIDPALAAGNPRQVATALLGLAAAGG